MSADTWDLMDAMDRNRRLKAENERLRAEVKRLQYELYEETRATHGTLRYDAAGSEEEE